jgi:hypothetical protein
MALRLPSTTGFLMERSTFATTQLIDIFKILKNYLNLLLYGYPIWSIFKEHTLGKSFMRMFANSQNF